jgi:hypothetical protein
MNKKFKTAWIAGIIVFSSMFGGMILFTDVYDEVFNGIVNVTCLSCIKLQPKTVIEFTFDTYQDSPHPDFILEDLKEGPVFIAYRTTVCDYCDVMEPIVEDIFKIDDLSKDETSGVKLLNQTDYAKYTLEYNGNSVIFYHINSTTSPKYLADTQLVYMNEIFKNANPMFTTITVRYSHSGIVKPYYSTVYGVLEKDTYNERKNVLTGILDDAIDLYKENIVAYE